MAPLLSTPEGNRASVDMGWRDTNTRQVIKNSVTNQPGMQIWDSINDAMCAEQKVVFKNVDDHVGQGGLKAMGDSMDRYYLLSIFSYFTGAMCWS